jgi:hypothetical protein
MKWLQTNHLAAKVIAGVGVGVMHYIEPSMIIALWLI